MNDYAKRISDEYASGNINSYMAERLAIVSEFGMTPDLMEQAVDDAISASSNDIDADGKFAIRFFVLNIADDMLNDTFGIEITSEEKDALCKYILKNKNDTYKLDNLTDFRILTYKWLRNANLEKKAYPNTYGKQSRETAYDTTKWTATAKDVYNIINKENVSHSIAIKLATANWDSDERFKFSNWLKYYESGNTEKYNVKTANKKQADMSIDDLGLPEHMLNPETRSNNIESRPKASYRKSRTKRDKELELATHIKRKMKSRLRSMRRLLDKYNEILSEHDLGGIQDEMYALDKSITKLNIYASMEDRIVRSANKFKKVGFIDGADLLYKFADDPIVAPEPEINQEEVVEKLPPPQSGEPDIPNIDLAMIIGRLEGLTKSLKSRDLVRDLSSVDILLNEIGLASYFPELGDSQSKLIEAFSYASNRIESIVSKLRGTGKSVSKIRTERSKPAPSKQTNINKADIKNRPIGEVHNRAPK